MMFMADIDNEGFIKLPEEKATGSGRNRLRHLEEGVQVWDCGALRLALCLAGVTLTIHLQTREAIEVYAVCLHHR